MKRRAVGLKKEMDHHRIGKDSNSREVGQLKDLTEKVWIKGEAHLRKKIIF